MSVAQNVLKQSLDMAAFCVNSYLQDLTDEDLLIRPVAGANHLAWQLGHLITAENNLINMVCPGSMPDLPDGFAERYAKENCTIDDPKAFDTKDEFVKLMNQQRAGTLAALNGISDEELDKPAPEPIREYCPSVGATFAMQATHWLMHSGQWVVVRRQLGRPPLF